MGPGHEYANKYAVELLPEDIKKTLSSQYCRKIVDWARYPDTRVPLEEEIKSKQNPLTSQEVAFLDSFGAKDLFSLHSHQSPGHGGSFILLVKSMIEKNPDKMAFWIANIMHTLIDDTVHTPLISNIVFGVQSHKIDIGEGIGFDFSDIAENAKGKKVIDDLLKDYKPRIISNNPQKALELVVTGSALAHTYGTQRELDILATYDKNASEKIRNNGIRALAEMGAYGIKRALDVINTAWKLAEDGNIPELTTKEMSRHKDIIAKYFASRPLKDDSIYSTLLNETIPQKTCVGILIEKSEAMLKSKLSFGGYFIISLLMRTLQKNNIEYNTLDLRTLDDKVPDVEKIPVIILCSGDFCVSDAVIKNLKKYTESGGHLLWIGGKDAGLLGQLSSCLIHADENLLPVTKVYGQNNMNIIDKIRIRFFSPFNKIIEDREYSFVNNPDTPAGSQKPLCLLEITSKASEIKILAKLRVGKKEIGIAAALMDKDNSSRYIFIPEYLFAPFLLVAPEKIRNITELTLDNIGENILLESLELLTRRNDRREAL
jgi:hypothetical protein